MKRYELLVKGGTVVDPSQALRTESDLAIAAGKVTALAPDIPADQAKMVVDATGKLVTPGLIDLHTHGFFACTPLGIELDEVCARSGVTTVVDAGSAGAQTFPGFRSLIIEPTTIRILAFLNISAIGILGIDLDEGANVRNCNVEEAVRVADKHRDRIIGIKVRASAEVVGDQGIVPLELARAAADRLGLPLMVHVGPSPPTLDAILARMRPGDILTHLFTGHADRVVDAQGKTRNCIVDGTRGVRQEVRQAKSRGVVMDVGHGASSFNFEVARAALAQGFAPDTISTDLHTVNINGPVYDLSTTLSKFLYLGMDLDEVILAATARPAEVIGRQGELGTLRVGAAADVALFELREGSVRFQDAYGNTVEGRQQLVNTLTICRGKPLNGQFRRKKDARWEMGSRSE